MYYSMLPWLYTLDYGVEKYPTSAEGLDAKRRIFEILEQAVSFAASATVFPKMFWFDHSTAWRSSCVAYIFAKYSDEIATRGLNDDLRAFLAAHAAKLLAFID